jgi:hypothetical protein
MYVGLKKLYISYPMINVGSRFSQVENKWTPNDIGITPQHPGQL